MTKEERAKLMPVTSAFWKEYAEEFGTPQIFVADENGQKVRFNVEPSGAKRPPAAQG